MLGALAAIVAGFLGAVHPLFDTLSHFRLHLSVLLAALAALWSLRCSRLPAFLFTLAGFAGAALSAPGLPLGGLAVQPAGGERVYRLFVMNLLWNNPVPQSVIALIDETDPDILFLTEYYALWRGRIGALETRYPHSYHCAEWRESGGSIVLSRLPILTGGDYCGDYASLGLTTIAIEGRSVAAGVVHLRWPWPASGPRQIDAFTPRLEALGANAIIAGDFNATTWSHALRRFARAGGLTITSGIGPTWGPSLSLGDFTLQWPPRLGLPIDNAMAKGAVRIVGARALAGAGSDHLPLLIEFVVRD